jgi:hypothetical protein
VAELEKACISTVASLQGSPSSWFFLLWATLMLYCSSTTGEDATTIVGAELMEARKFGRRRIRGGRIEESREEGSKKQSKNFREEESKQQSMMSNEYSSHTLMILS